MVAWVLPVIGWHAFSRWQAPPAVPSPAWVVIARALCWTVAGVAMGGVAAALVAVVALGWAKDVWGLTSTHPAWTACDFLEKNGAKLRREYDWPIGWLGYAQATLLGMACGLVPGVFLIHRTKSYLRLRTRASSSLHQCLPRIR